MTLTCLNELARRAPCPAAFDAYGASASLSVKDISVEDSERPLKLARVHDSIHSSTVVDTAAWIYHACAIEEFMRATTLATSIGAAAPIEHILHCKLSSMGSASSVALNCLYACMHHMAQGSLFIEQSPALGVSSVLAPATISAGALMAMLVSEVSFAVASDVESNL